jgi:hypothetical protein
MRSNDCPVEAKILQKLRSEFGNVDVFWEANDTIFYYVI